MIRINSRLAKLRGRRGFMAVLCETLALGVANRVAMGMGFSTSHSRDWEPIEPY